MEKLMVEQKWTKEDEWDITLEITVSTLAKTEDEAIDNAYDYIFIDADRGAFTITKVKRGENFLAPR